MVRPETGGDALDSSSAGCGRDVETAGAVTLLHLGVDYDVRRRRETEAQLWGKALVCQPPAHRGHGNGGDAEVAGMGLDTGGEQARPGGGGEPGREVVGDLAVGGGF